MDSGSTVASRRSMMMIVVVGAFSFLLIHFGWLAQAQDRADLPPFPPPDRPVAGIVSPEYSDEPTRDGHGEAERVLDRLSIRPPLRVADIGAGLGYYTVRLAQRLGPGATIYATDVKAEYLEQLRARLAREGIEGVTLILGLPRDYGCRPTRSTSRFSRTCTTRSRIPSSSSTGSSPRWPPGRGWVSSTWTAPRSGMARRQASSVAS